MSGWPMVAVSLVTTSSNGLDETTLNLRTWTSIVGISLPSNFYAWATVVRRSSEPCSALDLGRAARS